ncbi:MAG: cytidylate kinase-like family protein [Deltaproteobacteria bacterium]|nr:cytidylate kinase-like family protein [Deltaproteobacteria bacterium]
MTASLESIVEKQVHRWQMERDSLKRELLHGHVPRPVITISRLLGSGASEIAKQLAQELDCELVGIRIMDEVARRTNIRKELVDALDERVRSQISDWIDWIFRQRTLDTDEHYRHMLEVMNYFAEMGNVVMLGRGAGFMPKVRPRLDVRIVAPMARREKRVMELRRCTQAEAMYTINESDAHRARFINFLFGGDWWDDRNYDLVLNTANLTVDSAVAIIKTAWKCYAERHRNAWSYMALQAQS